MQKQTFYLKHGKRLFDMALAMPALVVLSPLLACIALLVGARLGSPVLFRQERAGLHGRAFMLYKFRTMGDEYDRQGRKIPDGDRNARLGVPSVLPE